MAVDYSDYLREAKAFLATASDEIRCRSSICKAYYSLYHVAVSHADAVHVPPVSSLSGPTHKNLSSFYANGLYPDKALQAKMKRVGYSLKILHEGRCKADYDLKATLSVIDADVHLRRCEGNIRLVEELIADRAA